MSKAQMPPGYWRPSLYERVLMFFNGIKENQHVMGFNWAAGQLLRGSDPLIVRVQATTHYAEGDPWRQGALAAIQKAKEASWA